MHMASRLASIVLGVGPPRLLEAAFLGTAQVLGTGKGVR